MQTAVERAEAKAPLADGLSHVGVTRNGGGYVLRGRTPKLSSVD